jgi:hypothetical protein
MEDTEPTDSEAMDEGSDEGTLSTEGINVEEGIATAKSRRKVKNFTMKLVHINVHHKKAAVALLCRKFALGEADIAPIQEPWVEGGQIRGLNDIGATIFPVTYGETLTSYIYVKNDINAIPLLEFFFYGRGNGVDIVQQ